MLCRDAIAAQLNSTRYALTVAAEMPSTNTALKELAAQGAPEGTTLIAETQTGGRGRRGRTFHSPDGGVYLSTLLRPAADTDPGQITCCAAVAAAEAIESLCDVKVDIKWVNDLYINGRKVAGILAEGVLSPEGRLTAIVLGIGINVAPCTFPADLAAIATSLGNEGAILTREAVAAAFLNGLAQNLCTDHGEVMAKYRRRSIVLGREVTVVRGSETYLATAEDVTAEGHLVVRTDANEIRTLSSGEVSVKL